MRTWVLLLVPAVLLGGLLLGVYKLQGLEHGTSVCSAGECPLELHESDTDQTFTYGVATRVTVFLNQNDNPPAHLQCAPEGIIGVVADAPHAVAPLYAVRFETVRAGTCILSDDRFSATIVVQ
jgi:hypothetical protein